MREVSGDTIPYDSRTKKRKIVPATGKRKEASGLSIKQFGIG